MARRSCWRTTAPDSYGGSGGRPDKSPPVSHTAVSHGPVCPWPNRNTRARTASSPASLPARVTAPSSAGSSAYAHRTPHARRLSSRTLAARSQPRTVPGGRPSRRAMLRCLSPQAARASASPITSAPSRRSLTARPPRPDRAHAVKHPHLAPAREPPQREPPATARARERTAGQIGLQPLRADRDQEHQESSVHTCRPKRSRPRRGREGAVRVGKTYQTVDGPAHPVSARGGPHPDDQRHGPPVWSRNPAALNSRDAAGKGGVIKRIVERTNPASSASSRSASRPSESEASGTSVLTLVSASACGRRDRAI
jgi:hypothetical protein